MKWNSCIIIPQTSPNSNHQTRDDLGIWGVPYAPDYHDLFSKGKLPALIIGVKDDLHGMPAFQQNTKKIPVITLTRCRTLHVFINSITPLVLMRDRNCYAISREVKPGFQLAGDTITFDIRFIRLIRTITKRNNRFNEWITLA